MSRPRDTVLEKWVEIEKLRTKLAKLRARKLDLDERAARLLVTANDLEETQIGAVRARLRELGVPGGE